MNRTKELIQQLSNLPTTDLKIFSEFYDESCHLLTPLEEAKGRKQIYDYYLRMRQDIQFKTFTVTGHLQNDDLICILWKSELVKLKKTMSVLGASYARFSKEGLILSQTDYWNINLRSPWLNFAISKLF